MKHPTPNATGLRPRIVELVTEYSNRGETLGSGQIRDILRVRGHSLLDALGNLVQQGRIENIGTPRKAQYRIKPKAPPSVALPNTRSIHDRGTYQGEELQRPAGVTEGRFEAYSLPRREGERLYWPGGKVTRLCGAAV